MDLTCYSGILKQKKYAVVQIDLPTIGDDDVLVWSGFSNELSQEDVQTGVYVVPFGRVHAAPREDLLAALKREDEGGTGEAAKLWNWCEEVTREYR